MTVKHPIEEGFSFGTGNPRSGGIPEIRKPRIRHERLAGRVFAVLEGVAIGLVSVLLLHLMWFGGAERLAVDQFTPTERAAVYEETWRVLQVLCNPPRPELRDYCRERARFLTPFPECEQRCHDLTETLLSSGAHRGP